MLKTCISLSSLQVKHGHSKLVWCALIGKTFYYYRNHEEKVIPFPLLFLNPPFPFLMMLSFLLLLVCLMLQALPWLYYSPSNSICSTKRINILSDFFFLKANMTKGKWLLFLRSLCILFLAFSIWSCEAFRADFYTVDRFCIPPWKLVATAIWEEGGHLISVMCFHFWKFGPMVHYFVLMMLKLKF